MHITRILLATVALSLSAGSYLAVAQQPAAPQQPMTFFVTSVSKGDGANYGGLAGADAHCQSLAQAAGRGNVKWVAYLSTQGPGAVNARDRIGQGPWYNARGAMIAANLGELHGDTLEQARLGNRLHRNSALTEKGAMVKGVGDTPNEHDILTGSTLEGRAFTDGMDHTCSNYSSSADTAGANVQVGHHDRIGNTNASWVSAHPSRGCSAKALPVSGGAGYLYCFAPGN